MTGKFTDILFNIVIQFRWKYIALLFVFFFFGSWSATSYFEPKAEIISKSNYWWYFLNNVLRGSYSGYNPTTTGGRLVSFVSFFGGGVFFIATICKITATSYEQTQLKKKGLAQLKMKRHIVILGYRNGETESLIAQLQGDHLVDKKIVLCSRHLTENPFHGKKVEFVKGDTSSEEVMRQACVHDADVIVVHGHTDDRTLAIGIAANTVMRRDAHMVAYFDKQENAKFLKMVNPAIECVTSMRTMLIAQAVFNPGATEILRELISLSDPGTNFRIDLPHDISPIRFVDLMAIFYQEYRAIPIGYVENRNPSTKPRLNPPQNTVIRGGMAVYYIAEYRIDHIIDWNLFYEEAVASA